jgi:hypothetical protein
MIITIDKVSLNVEKTSKAGSSYTCHEVSYTNQDGKSLTKNIFSSSPISNAIATEITAGDFADVKVAKNGKFFEWVAISKTDKAAADKAKAAPRFTRGSTKSSFDTQGARIGNITNCAATIFANKLTKTLTEAVDLVIESQQYIESKISETPSTTTTATETVEETKTESTGATDTVWEISGDDDTF